MRVATPVGYTESMEMKPRTAARIRAIAAAIAAIPGIDEDAAIDMREAAADPAAWVSGLSPADAAWAMEAATDAAWDTGTAPGWMIKRGYRIAGLIGAWGE